MSLIKYVGGLKSFLEKREIESESSIFQLHYKFSVVLLLGSSILLTAAELFGNPIDCIVSKGLPSHVINTYCWIKSTFTIQDYHYREYGQMAVQPGVGPAGLADEELEAKWRYHNYYQWVVFFLFFQAALCYFPKFLWNISEGGLMVSIANGLNRGLFKEEEVAPRKKVIIEYIVKHIKMHNSYVFKYWFCEFVCFLNIIGQLFLINSFLGGEFFSYGPKVVEFSNMDQEHRVDPMIYVFPA